MGKLSPAEKQRRSYNRDLKALQGARDTATNAEYEELMIAHDKKWCPEVVERRQRDGLYRQWALSKPRI